MAYPDWYVASQKEAGSRRVEIDRKRTLIRSLKNEIEAKTGEIAQLQSEIEQSESQTMTSELPILLTYNVVKLDVSTDGRDRFYHKRTYYYADKDVIKEIPLIYSSEERNNNVLPGTIDLSLNFKQSGKTVDVIACDLKSVILHILDGTSVESWKQLGELVNAYYNPQDS